MQAARLGMLNRYKRIHAVPYLIKAQSLHVTGVARQ